MKVKSSELSICIFTKKYYPSVSQYPEAEQKVFAVFGQVISDLRKRHGQDLKVYMDYCSIEDATNAAIVSANGLSIQDLPAVQLWAEYPDGTGSNYFIQKDIQDKFGGINWTTKDVRPYVEALLYQLKAAEPSWLCKLFPPLCNLSPYVWLGVAVGSGIGAAVSRRPLVRLAFAAGALVAGKEFVDRGGLDIFTKNGDETDGDGN